MICLIYDRITSGVRRDSVPLLDLPNDETQTDDSVPIVHIEPSLLMNGYTTHDNAKYLRAKLRFFFMSPCWKWHLKKQFPWKAWFQFIKIFFVTTQVNISLLSENKSNYSFFF